MKERIDIVRGWLRKAQSDLVAMDASLNAGSLDTAGFHAQQAAEKYLKAFLVSAGIGFPFTHNLRKLVEICSSVDSSFDSLLDIVDLLTPHAVELRYDTEYWPSDEDIAEVRERALSIRDFVISRLPTEVTGGV